jgi:lipopolysaccharide export system protein LptC
VAFRLFTLLAVIALGISTWILSSPSHRPTQPSSGAGASLPGYYLKNAVLTDFDANGNPTVRIHADRIDQIDHGPDIALTNVRVDYQAPGGESWILLGDTGRVETGGKIVDVAGNVKLSEVSTERAAPAVLHTDTLRYDVATGIASTASDVRVDFGLHALTARGLVANLKDRTMRLESRVNGRFQP